MCTKKYQFYLTKHDASSMEQVDTKKVLRFCSDDNNDKEKTALDIQTELTAANPGFVFKVANIVSAGQPARFS